MPSVSTMNAGVCPWPVIVRPGHRSCWPPLLTAVVMMKMTVAT